MSGLGRAPDFWRSAGGLSRLLAPAATIWGAVAARRMSAPAKHRAPVPVIAVGNFTAGGAGKTPTTLALVGLARRAGFSPAVLTRGFGGRLPGPLVVDPARHDAAQVGDEPLLHARLAPTIVARDRVAGSALALDRGADLLILDDGFQNPTLAKDEAIVVVDRGYGIGNGRVLPAGPLRAPLDVQLDHASALVVIDAGEPDAPSLAPLLAEARRRGLPVVAARLALREPARFAGRRLLAWAGIGRPEKFAATLAAAGAEVVDLAAFGDHQHLSEADAEALLARAAEGGLDLVTTEKDAARLAGAASSALTRLVETSTVAAVDLAFDDEAAITALLAPLR
jgi:tetraacyldisaccharide 4'-kinase